MLRGLPAAPGLHPAEYQDEDHDRVREGEGQRYEGGVAGDPDPGGEGRHRPAAVQREHREQVDQVDEEADVGERLPELVARRQPDPERHERGDRAEHRAGQAHAGLRRRVVAHRLRGHDRAQERDEHRRRGLNALAPQLDHVAQLVEEEQQDEAERERPRPDQRVGGDRHEHRRRRREDLQLREQEQDRLALGREQHHAGADRAEQVPCALAPAAAAAGPRLDRLVLALGRRLGRPGGGSRIGQHVVEELSNASINVALGIRALAALWRA